MLRWSPFDFRPEHLARGQGRAGPIALAIRRGVFALIFVTGLPGERAIAFDEAVLSGSGAISSKFARDALSQGVPPDRFNPHDLHP